MIPQNMLKLAGISADDENSSGYKMLAELLYEQMSALSSQVSTLRSLLESALGGPEVVSVMAEAGVVTVERL